MKNLDSRVLEKFIKAAGEQLTGEWLLIGGTLLPAVGLDIRSTVDIDLIGLGPAESAQQIELMTIAESLNLPVDTINQAAFFLRKLNISRDDLIVLHRGAQATLFRPSVSLYWRLKIQRMSETDVEDCRHYFEFCRKVGDPISVSDLKKEIVAKIELEGVTPKKARLRILKELLSVSK